jgi:hypothetical protein
MTSEQCDAFQNSLQQAQTRASQIKDQFGADSKEYQDAQRAIASYGEQGVDNGVLIRIGAVPPGAQASTLGTDGNPKTDLNPTGQKIWVTFDKDTFNNFSPGALGEVAAHEGSHVADASDWARANFADLANPTNLQSEFRAYGINISFGRVQGNTQFWTGDHQHLFWWDRTAPANDILRTNMIKAVYPNWAEKAFQRNTQGGGR